MQDLDRVGDARAPNILLVDDEAPARARLRALIEEGQMGVVVGEAADGVAALVAVHALRPDVVLMDVRMPRMSGIDAAEQIAEMSNAPAVIFTTAYEHHALAAFEARAIDYLLKPVRAKRLAEALARAAKLAPSPSTSLAPATLTHNSAGRSHLGDSERLVPVADIILLRAEHKYVNAYLADGEVLLEEALAALEQEFGERFLRVHRNALVAVAHIREMKRDADGRWHLILRGLTLSVEVSRRMVATVRGRLSG